MIEDEYGAKRAGLPRKYNTVPKEKEKKSTGS